MELGPIVHAHGDTLPIILVLTRESSYRLTSILASGIFNHGLGRVGTWRVIIEA
jgi:hypothetical protein